MNPERRERLFAAVLAALAEWRENIEHDDDVKRFSVSSPSEWWERTDAVFVTAAAGLVDSLPEEFDDLEDPEDEVLSVLYQLFASGPSSSHDSDSSQAVVGYVMEDIEYGVMSFIASQEQFDDDDWEQMRNELEAIHNGKPGGPMSSDLIDDLTDWLSERDGLAARTIVRELVYAAFIACFYDSDGNRLKRSDG